MLLLALLLQTSDPAARADTWIRQQMTARKIPGLSVAVIQDGQVLFERAYGAASLELNVPVTTSTRFAIASTTKALSSTAMMLLVNQGRVGLDQPVGDFLSNLPATWRGVTIRRLLSHTGGLPDIVDSPNTGTPIASTRDSALALAGAKPVDFSPGDKWSYNQTGYVLLGMVIERVAGMPFERFILERITTPLGLGSAQFGDARALVTGRAYTYTRFAMTPNGPTPLDSLRTIQFTYPPFMQMAAGLNLSAIDLARFGDAVRSGRVLTQGWSDSMWTAVRLNDGKVFRFGGESGFGLGWQVDDTPGGRWVGMEGAAASGFRVYPDRKLTVAVLTNLQGAGPGDLVDGVAGFWK
jgi:CubicO group peptidase (beta-lactamase class C family)